MQATPTRTLTRRRQARLPSTGSCIGTIAVTWTSDGHAQPNTSRFTYRRADCFLQHSKEQGRSHGSEDCGALHAPDQHQHRRPPAPESRPRNGGELPAKHAPLIFSMLVPPTRHCYCHFGNLTYHHRVLPSICQQTAGCSATPSDNRLLRWQHVRVRAADEVTEGSALRQYSELKSRR